MELNYTEKKLLTNTLKTGNMNYVHGSMTAHQFVEYSFHRHDTVVNQRYPENSSTPYSLHLKAVISQYKHFKHLLDNDGNLEEIIWMGCAGHDLIEDARITYNNIKDLAGEIVADIIYCCTEEKGKDRPGRHNERYFAELKLNRPAVFVKLCDIIANVKFGLLENSSMFNKYKKEFPEMKAHLYGEGEYKEMFDYLETILKLN